MLIRALLIFVILFGVFGLLVWTLFKTNYFSKQRAINIGKNTLMVAAAMLAAIIAFSFIGQLDHSI